MKTKTKLFIILSFLTVIVSGYVLYIKMKNETYNEDDAAKIWNDRIKNVEFDSTANKYR